MAVTDFGSLTGAQVKLWAAQTWKAGRDNSFWNANGFIGKSMEDMNSPVYLVNQLTPSPQGAGLSCVMQMVQDMVTDGVSGDNQLTGQEEALATDLVTIQIDMLRNGIKSKGKMAEQATVIRFREQAKDKLAFWFAQKQDELMFLTASGRSYSLNTNGSARGVTSLTTLSFAADVVAPSANRIMYAGTATSEATLTTSNTFNWNLMSAARAKAERAKMRPIRQGGKDYYVIVMSPEQRRDLVQDPNYQTIVSRAAERGQTQNPLFNNALVTVDGMILYEHNKVFNTSGLTSGNKWGSGGTVDGAQALLLGAQALGYAKVQATEWSESDITDYGNRPGIGYGAKFGLLKPQFKPNATAASKEDYGIISIKTAAALQ